MLLSARLAAWFKIIAVGMITLVAFEATAVGTAMPFVVDDLGGNQFYALAAGIPLAAQIISTVFAGRWADAKGPHQVMYVGMASFMGGLVLCTFAPNIYLLVLGRAVQGIGGGLLMVPLYVMVGAYVLPRKQAAFFAAFAIAWVLPSMFGPVIAGTLVDYVHWRWCFGVTPLVFVLFFPFVWPKFRQFPSLHAALPLRIPLWLLTVTLATGGMVMVLQVISGVSPDDFTNWLLVASVVVCAVLLFCVSYLVPAGTFLARRGVPATVALRALLNGTFIATETYLPYILKNVHNWGPTQAGLVMTASGVTWACGSWLLGRMKDQRLVQLVSFLGPIGGVIGMSITLLPFFPGVNPWWTLVGWSIGGFAVGLVYPTTSVNTLALTPPERHGVLSSSLQVADTFGSSFLIAVGGIIHAYTFALGDISFVYTLGVQVALMALAIWVSRRIFLDDPAKQPDKVD